MVVAVLCGARDVVTVCPAFLVLSLWDDGIWVFGWSFGGDNGGRLGRRYGFFWSGGRWMGLGVGLAGFDVEVVGGFGGVAVVGDLVAAVGAVDCGVEVDAQGAPFAFD